MKDVVQRVGGVLVVVMGLARLDVLRGPLARERRLLTKPLPGAGPRRPFVLGVAFGAASSPGAAAGLRRISRPVQIVGGVVLIVLGLLLLTGWYAHLSSYPARFSPKVAGR